MATPNNTIIDLARSGPKRPDEATRLKRVLYPLCLDPAGKFGSIEEQALTLARAFRERGSLFLPTFLGPLDPESAGAYAREGLYIESLDLRTFHVDTFRRLFGLIGRHRIEIVHWNFYDPWRNPYLWALTVSRPGLEHYFTDHISRPFPDRRGAGRRAVRSRFKRIIASRYGKLLCISDYILAYSREEIGPRVRRTRYFVNSERFRPDHVRREGIRRELGVGGEVVLISVAHLIKDKGIDVALDAMARLPREVVLWVVGDGPERAALEARAEGLGLGGRVRFLGMRRHVEPFLQAADIAVCPSVWGEAVGLFNIEAMACGLPVVASRIGGIPEFVEDGRNGLLFTPGDHRELADRIRSLLDDPSAMAAMGREARSMTLLHHADYRLIPELIDLYRDAAR